MNQNIVLVMKKIAGKSINNTFGDYVLAHSLGVDQKMKLEYKVGERTYEKN